MTSARFDRRHQPVHFDAGNPGPLTGQGNNTWLLDGAQPTLIDGGVGRADHVDALARHLDGRPLTRVIVTHGHADHASGVPALRERWPELETCRFAVPGEETGGATVGAATNGATSWRLIGDGEMIPAGDTTLRVVHTPGHAPDHVCLWHEPSRDVFVGDMLALGTTVMIPAGRGGHLRSYLASLERLAALRPARALPGHGPLIDDPMALIGEYLEHRRMRERQVLRCLGDGLSETDDIVSRIYPDATDAVRRAAAVTVEAHLEKLREDGMIGPRGRAR